MDEDDIPLEQLRKICSIVTNDQMLTPLDPAIEFTFDSNEIFNFDLTNFDLYTFYEKSLNVDPLDTAETTDAHRHAEAKAEQSQVKDPKRSSASEIKVESKPCTSDPAKPIRPGEKVETNEAVEQNPVEPNADPENPAFVEKMYIIQCGFCQFHTVSLHGLRVHMRRHVNRDGKKYKCYYCNFLTNKSYYLRQHGAYMHGSAYNCEFCVFKTYSNSKMMSHIRHIH